ncbi:MAG: N-formylglutamate amidohydrolase [Gammaproteobacteria bacterium]|nr:N-formylglutamate amidohydrolase [Gammaproteobacteria bacterium]
MAPDSTDHVPASSPLIGRDDPAPFVVLHEHGEAPALIVCDHASRAFPKGMQRLGLPVLQTWEHIAWDIGAGELARGISNALDAPAVLAGYSRLIVDCNRQPDDPEAFRKESDGWVIPGNQVLSEFERRVRLACFFDPYHEAIAALLGGFRTRSIVPLVVSVHTFTPQMGGEQRPWHVGVLWDKDPESAARMLAGLRAIDGLVVGENQPYSGKHPANYTIDHHVEPAGLPHVCIEVRQDQLESPAGVERWVRILSRLIGEVMQDPALRRLRLPEAPWPRANHL